jgi:hypothetical protein
VHRHRIGFGRAGDFQFDCSNRFHYGQVRRVLVNCQHQSKTVSVGLKAEVSDLRSF